VTEKAWRVRGDLALKDHIIMTEGDRYFVPYRMRLKVLTVGHGAHCGVEQTISRIRSKFFWPGLNEAVKQFVAECRTCALVKPSFISPDASPLLVKSPLEVMACDFIGPLPISFGCKYALVVVDLHSRYPFLFPLTDMKVNSVIKCFKKIFSFVGFPNAILSDRGSNFESYDFKNFLSGFGIKKLRTHAYRPSGNGICERVNGVLKKSMKSYLTERSFSANEWVKSIDHVLLQYRTTPHTVTKCRPVDLMFSFNARGYLPHQPFETSKAVESDLAAKEVTKARLDKKSSNRCFAPGEEVIVKDPYGKKFCVEKRVFKILKQIDNFTCEIKDTCSPFSISRISTSRLSKVPLTKDLSAKSDKGAHQELSSTEDEVEDIANAPPAPLRRSTRVRTAPDRLTYN